jgi:hypothetical protein
MAPNEFRTPDPSVGAAQDGTCVILRYRCNGFSICTPLKINIGVMAAACGAVER